MRIVSPTRRLDQRDTRRIQQAQLWAEWAMKPWVDQIVRVRMSERPTYELTSDGLNLVSDGLSDIEHEIIRKCEGVIAAICKEANQMAGVA